MSTIHELNYIYRNERTCRVCKQSHRVASSAPRDNFGKSWICTECYPTTPESAAALTSRIEAERLQVIAQVEARREELKDQQRRLDDRERRLDALETRLTDIQESLLHVVGKAAE